MTHTPKAATCLWSNGEAEAAARFYTSLIPDSYVTNVLHPDADGPAVMVEFVLGGAPFQVLTLFEVE